MGLMHDIRAFPVPNGALGIWWLGQNGFIFKSPEGTLVSTDLYLTDSCAALGAGIGVDLGRAVPVLMPPGEVDVDVFTCTHSHQDHTDPETIRGLRNRDTTMFVGPHPSCAVFRAEGIEEGRIQPAWPQGEIEHRDLRLRGTFALPTDTSDLNHMGFLLQFGDGPKVYITGDTDYTELLEEAAVHKPDLVITVINGGFNNLSHWEAARLVKMIQPRAAIPCHYDMFRTNSVDPRMFEASLKIHGAGASYWELRHGEPNLFEV